MADKSGDIMDKAAEQLLDLLISEAQKHNLHWYHADATSAAILNKYLPGDAAATGKALVQFSHELLEAHREGKNFERPKNIREKVLRLVISSSVDKFHTLDDQDLYTIIYNWHEVMKEDYSWYEYPNVQMAGQVIKKIEASGLTEPLRQSLELLKYPRDFSNTKERRKFNDKIDLILQGNQELPVNRLDPIGGQVMDFIGSLEGTEGSEQWKRLVKHCYASQEKTVPPKKWLDEARQIMGQMDTSLFAQKMQEWLG